MKVLRLPNIKTQLYSFKHELGDDVDVRYVKPGEDPSSKRDEGFAILNDGSVMQMTRKPNIVLDD